MFTNHPYPCTTPTFLLAPLTHRNKAVPQPFTSVPAPEEVQYLSDIRVYDTQNMAWHGVRAMGSGGSMGGSGGGGGDDEEELVLQPEGRYGMYFVIILCYAVSDMILPYLLRTCMCIRLPLCNQCNPVLMPVHVHGASPYITCIAHIDL